MNCEFLQCLGLLLLNLRLGLGRCGDTPHLVEGVHVEGQVVELSLVVGYRRIGVAVEWHDTVDKVPDGLVAGVEDVRSVFVHVDAIHILAIEVSTQVRTFVYDQASFAFLSLFPCKAGTVESGPYYQIIVFHG